MLLSSPPLDDDGVVFLPALITVAILEVPAALDVEVSILDEVVMFVDDVISKETSELFAIVLYMEFMPFSADNL